MPWKDEAFHYVFENEAIGYSNEILKKYLLDRHLALAGWALVLFACAFYDMPIKYLICVAALAVISGVGAMIQALTHRVLIGRHYMEQSITDLRQRMIEAENPTRKPFDVEAMFRDVPTAQSRETA